MSVKIETLQAEMSGSPETAVILDALNATRASARERQDELERKIRGEARKLRQGAADGTHSSFHSSQNNPLAPGGEW